MTRVNGYDETTSRVQAANALVRHVTAAAALPALSIPGAMMVQYPEADPDSGNLPPPIFLQTVLLSPEGIGIVKWDDEARAAARAVAGGMEAAARHFYRPYDDCEADLRTLMNARLPALLAQVEERLGSA